MNALEQRLRALESYHQIVSTPTFTNGTTTFTDRILVTIDVPTGTTVRYTLDGTEPNAQSDEYTGPFYIDSTKTIGAKAFSGNSSSQAVYATYTKQEPVVITVSAPTINGRTGDNNDVSFTDAQLTVTVTPTDSSATTYFTRNGSTPTEASTEANAAGSSFTITTGETVKARSYKNGVWSDTTVVIFTKTEPTPSSNIYYVGTDVNEANNYQSYLNYDDSNFPTSLTLNDETLYFAIPTNKEVIVEDSTSHGTFTQRVISTENGYNIIKVPKNDRTITGTVNITLN